MGRVSLFLQQRYFFLYIFPIFAESMTKKAPSPFFLPFSFLSSSFVISYLLNLGYDLYHRTHVSGTHYLVFFHLFLHFFYKNKKRGQKNSAFIFLWFQLCESGLFYKIEFNWFKICLILCFTCGSLKCLSTQRWSIS